ncbi:MAG: hypothetical protein E6H41_11875 [Betaproteobacteria bacterium]|nr:MAG: hypothetical protein E6H41_11875 [Betaproteobacteria bacterium]
MRCQRSAGRSVRSILLKPRSGSCTTRCSPSKGARRDASGRMAGGSAACGLTGGERGGAGGAGEALCAAAACSPGSSGGTG